MYVWCFCEGVKINSSYRSIQLFAEILKKLLCSLICIVRQIDLVVGISIEGQLLKGFLEVYH